MRSGVLIFLLLLLAILGVAVNRNYLIQEKNLVGDANIHLSIADDLGPRQTRSWTILVYLDADNNLESAGIDDFLEMSSVGSSSSIAVVTLFDRWTGTGDNETYDDETYGNWTDTKLFYITKGLEPYPENALEDWGEKDMGDPQTLIDFINYTLQNYPAEHYALVLWDHGGGYYGCCWDDDNSRDNLDLSELRYALKYAYEELHIKFDIIGFDACLMGNIEVAYELRDYADIVVFSQEYEPGDGWPYDMILSALINNPSMSPEDLASTIVSSYLSYYQDPEHNDPNATMSAINISYLERYTFAAINRVSGYLLRYYDQYNSTIHLVMNNTETFYYSWQKDLTHFLILLRDEVNDSYLIDLINDAIGKLNSSIIAYGHLDNHPNAYGLSAYIYDAYFSLYYGLDSSRDHQWDEFQKKLANSDPGIWFYDIKLYGSDVDGDGIFDTDIKLWIDLDAELTTNVTVDVYGYNGYVEQKVGTANYTIQGATPDDAINVSLSIWNNATYSFRIVIYNSEVYKEFGYFCDSNISYVPLETTSASDLEPPTITVLEPINDTYINNHNVIVTWRCSDNVAIDHIEIRIDSGSWINIGNVTSYEIRNLDDGEHIVYVKAVDVYGNTNVSSVRIIVDTKPPTIIILKPTNGTITNETIVELSWNFSDANIDYFNITINDSIVVDRYTKTNYTISIASNGTYEISVIGVDRAGNIGVSSVIITIDTKPPVIRVLKPKNNSVLYRKTFSLVLEINDNLGVESASIFIDEHKYSEVFENYSNITISINIAGKHVIKIVAHDLAGNSNQIVLVITVKGEINLEGRYIGLALIIILVLLAIAIILRKK